MNLFFSLCCAKCATCSCSGHCYAGHGDDEYSPASLEEMIERLDKGEYASERDKMIQYVKDNFDYDYEEKKKKKK